MIWALLLWSPSSFCYFFLLLFNTSATPPANKHCSQKSVSEPVLAKSLTHQHPSARRSIIEKETIGRVPCHQLACYEWNANVFVSGSMIFFLQAIEKRFPAKLSVHSFSHLAFRENVTLPGVFQLYCCWFQPKRRQLEFDMHADLWPSL